MSQLGANGHTLRSHLNYLRIFLGRLAPSLDKLSSLIGSVFRPISTELMDLFRQPTPAYPAFREYASSTLWHSKQIRSKRYF